MPSRTSQLLCSRCGWYKINAPKHAFDSASTSLYFLTIIHCHNAIHFS